ncbi:hypothetical protein F4818DRAFT_141652 [Hypoxylon cercidicola]|nr:hypothetical protein F4818DRAFT_141652 [Hypoxylon cercidicola]
MTDSLMMLKGSAGFLRSRIVTALLSTFVVHGPTTRASSFVVQYTSTRFGWSLEGAGILLSLRAAINIVLLLILLPACSSLLLSRRMPFRLTSTTKDLLLARISVVLLISGALLPATSSKGSFVAGLVVFTLGTGFSAQCRALILALVDSEHAARLSSLITIFDAYSSLWAGPSLTQLFTEGNKLKEYWLGLLYIGVAFLCSLAAAAIFSVISNSVSPVKDNTRDISGQTTSEDN